MLLIRNCSIALAMLMLAACSKNGCRPDDPCACTDPSVCAVSAGEAACDFAKRAGDRVFFAFDKDALTEESKATLVKQACWLKANECRKVIIEGHCDIRGTSEYNLGLGHRRAQMVKNFLIEQCVEEGRITVISYGKDKPIEVEGATNQEEIHQANRVAISVIE